MTPELRVQVDDHEMSGCTQQFLGVVKMPKGYALMLNADASHYYFLHESGKQSVIHWNRWAIYKWAKLDSGKYPELVKK